MQSKNAPHTNGGSLRSYSTASEQPMFDFGPRMHFSRVKLGKIRLKQPPFAPHTFNSNDEAQKVLLNRLGLSLPQRLRRIDEVVQM